MPVLPSVQLTPFPNLDVNLNRPLGEVQQGPETTPIYGVHAVIGDPNGYTPAVGAATAVAPLTGGPFGSPATAIVSADKGTRFFGVPTYYVGADINTQEAKAADMYENRGVVRFDPDEHIAVDLIGDSTAQFQSTQAGVKMLVDGPIS
jgi:hypothetical protein